jgi:hypothetical protein
VNQLILRLPDSWIEKIFERLSSLYGTAFTAKWNGIDSQNVKRVWAETLAGMTGEQIKAALIECGRTCAYPPSAPEFYQLCKAQKVLPMHQKLIPKLHDKNIDEGMKRIAKMRDILAKNKTVKVEV